MNSITNTTNGDAAFSFPFTSLCRCEDFKVLLISVRPVSILETWTLENNHPDNRGLRKQCLSGLLALRKASMGKRRILNYDFPTLLMEISGLHSGFTLTQALGLREVHLHSEYLSQQTTQNVYILDHFTQDKQVCFVDANVHLALTHVMSLKFHCPA